VDAAVEQRRQCRPAERIGNGEFPTSLHGIVGAVAVRFPGLLPGCRRCSRARFRAAPEVTPARAETRALCPRRE
jgi:hypothetical protein